VATSVRGVRITSYELFEVAPRWQFLKIGTDAGTVGWGEVYAKWHYAGDDTVTASAGAVDVAQPDVSHAGGITESKRIADAASSHGVALAYSRPVYEYADGGVGDG